MANYFSPNPRRSYGQAVEFKFLPKKRCYFPIHNFFAIIFCIITMFTYYYYVWRPRCQWISFVYSKNLFQIGQPPSFPQSCKYFCKKSRFHLRNVSIAMIPKKVSCSRLVYSQITYSSYLRQMQDVAVNSKYVYYFNFTIIEPFSSAFSMIAGTSLGNPYFTEV